MAKKLEIVWRDPGTLTPYIKNAKVHSNEQIDKIAGQIAAFGFDQPIVVDKKGVIIKGHGRREAAIRLKLKKVPVVVSTLDQYQAMAARIGDNKVAEAPWDPELLKFDLESLKLEEFDLALTAMDMDQIFSITNPQSSEDIFSENDHKSVSERKEQYDSSDLRQMILVMDPVTFDAMMNRFASLQDAFGVETNLEVVEKLMDHYAESNPSVFESAVHASN